MRPGARLLPRILARGREAVHAALVPTQAGPLAGDEDTVVLRVGPGAVLVLEPVAATLALPGADPIRLVLDARVEAGGRLVVDEPPLVVAEGTTVERRVDIALGAGAVAALRDHVVLGRDGEAPGTLTGVLRATLGGEALLHDALRVGPGSGAARVALPPEHRVIGCAVLLGAPAPDLDDPMLLRLAGPGALRRATAIELPEAEAPVAAAWRAFRTVALAAAAAPVAV